MTFSTMDDARCEHRTNQILHVYQLEIIPREAKLLSMSPQAEHEEIEVVPPERKIIISTASELQDKITRIITRHRHGVRV